MVHGFDIPDNIYKKLLSFYQDKSEKFNSNLAGNIREEYSLMKYSGEVQPFIIEQLFKIEDLVEHFNKIDVLYPNSTNLILSTFWVNFQKKYEFNPIHNHAGIFSFIFFIKIPYLAEEERLISPGKDAHGDRSGKLSFFHLDSTSRGGIKETTLDVDKKWEKRGLIFRSDLNHCVYPFFSEGERITMSGNISLFNGINTKG
jgi:hypothetical protein